MSVLPSHLPSPHPSVLYYAMGGGLGHLARARAVLHTLGVEGSVTLLTASPLAGDGRVHGFCNVIAPDPALAHDLPRYRLWLRKQFNRLRPSALYLDAFPAGILGEFCDFELPEIPVYHFARLLRWPRYCRQLTTSLPALTTTFVLEPLDPAHDLYLHQQSDHVQRLDLRDPPSPRPQAVLQHLQQIKQDGQPLWLIVHAGKEAEIAELVHIATERSKAERQQPRLVLLAPHRPQHLPTHIIHLDVYPAHPLFPLADRLITAGGFNAMRQATPFADRHMAHPFYRRFDDQFARVALHREQHHTLSSMDSIVLSGLTQIGGMCHPDNRREEGFPLLP